MSHYIGLGAEVIDKTAQAKCAATFKGHKNCFEAKSAMYQCCRKEIKPAARLNRNMCFVGADAALKKCLAANPDQATDAKIKTAVAATGVAVGLYALIQAFG